MFFALPHLLAVQILKQTLYIIEYVDRIGLNSSQMPPSSISPLLNKQRIALCIKKVPGIPHPLLLSFLAGKLAFKHIYKDDDSLYDAIKSTPVFANILADLEDDSVCCLV